MELSIGELRRYLSFYHVYKVLETEAQFDEMMKDGWFPFVEILAGEYKKLSEAYQNKFDFENKIKASVDSFGEERIKKITDKVELSGMDELSKSVDEKKEKKNIELKPRTFELLKKELGDFEIVL